MDLFVILLIINISQNYLSMLDFFLYYLIQNVIIFIQVLKQVSLPIINLNLVKNFIINQLKNFNHYLIIHYLLNYYYQMDLFKLMEFLQINFKNLLLDFIMLKYLKIIKGYYFKYLKYYYHQQKFVINYFISYYQMDQINYQY